MRDAFNDVLDFHQKLAPHLIGRFPAFPDERVAKFRVDMIEEELEELKEAVADRDIVKTADALADICYVVLGMAVTLGIDLPDVWREVHASNMAKEGGPTRDDGKILKPDGWQPPDVERALSLQFPVPARRTFENLTNEDCRDLAKREEAHFAKHPSQ